MIRFERKWCNLIILMISSSFDHFFKVSNFCVTLFLELHTVKLSLTMSTFQLVQSYMDILSNACFLPHDTEQQAATWNTIYALSFGFIAFSGFTFFAEMGLGIHAKYGRFSQLSSSSIKVPAKIAWFIQELPSWAIPTWFLIKSFGESFESVPIANRLLLSLFVLHYTNRTFVFPLRIRGGKKTPFLEFAMAFIFTACNGLLQGLCLTKCDKYKVGNVYGYNFMFGSLLFLFGFGANIHSDAILRNLRKPNEKDSGYKIPFGGLFEFVTAANYFSEFMEWTGFAIAGCNAGGLAFALSTFSNLFPRAIQNHNWYLKKFEDYPKDRKIFFPFLL